jgi:tRNA1(Val) A37 N6-methylase TrmN6
MKAFVLGIDVQKDAADLSFSNFQNAPFSDRLKVVNDSFYTNFKYFKFKI